ncbi:hypothetical protein AQUCO_02300163v1 [Aquilegia coerulea]|uniref:Bifunctional inhibitor/plant lipid transfer protein/seed storage helical domain-containing protein n=1 Tax=Aquilegia coerulea TaxID=218851 RepID=A0A2G5DCC0_AQUCA|nr:hypothetical protein AQUCO_02300163v1 [Aquilegia coerulea]
MPTPPSTPSTPVPIPTPPSTPVPIPTPPSTPSTPTPMPTPPSTPSTPTPMPTPPTPPSSESCPIDTLKLGVCGDLLGGLVNIIVGTPPNSKPCCSLIQGIADLDAAVCLCTALKANILGINLNVPISLTLLLNTCGKNAPSGFECHSS